jgi:hypothetical protein
LATTAVVGIDVSKDTLDACLLLPGGRAKEHAFGNDPRGHAALLAWAGRHAAGGSWCPSVHDLLRSFGRPAGAIGPTRQQSARAGRTTRSPIPCDASAGRPDGRTRVRQEARGGPAGAAATYADRELRVTVRADRVAKLGDD